MLQTNDSPAYCTNYVERIGSVYPLKCLRIIRNFSSRFVVSKCVDILSIRIQIHVVGKKCIMTKNKDLMHDQKTKLTCSENFTSNPVFLLLYYVLM